MNVERPVQYVLLIILACFIFGGGFMLGKSNFFASSPPEVVEAQPEADEEVNKEIVVYVSGAVQKPGVYRLKSEARIVDALELAQPLAEADLEKINLAQALLDGQQIPIPFKGEESNAAGVLSSPAAPNTTSSTANSSSPGQKININTATQAELETLPGIGPSLAQRIITYRTEHGPFRTPEDIKEVSGIGDKRYADLAPLITVY